jgi:hypothetical protein
MAFPVGNNAIKIVCIHDGNLILLEPTKLESVQVEGVVYQDTSSLIGALLSIVYSEIEVQQFNIGGEPINLLNDNIAASNVFGGSQDQPNVVGKKNILVDFVGDGVQNQFTVVAPFTIKNLNFINIRCVRLRSDGIILVSYPGNGLTVSGYDTTQIQVQLDQTPPAGEYLEVLVISDEDDPDAEPTLITTLGYDNWCNSIMSLCFGAHGYMPNSNGHNTIIGGSYGRSKGSFNTVGGKGVWAGFNDPDTIGCFGYGNGIFVDGQASVAIGWNLKVNGKGSFLFGRDGEIDGFNEVLMSGRKGKAFSNDERILSGGSPNDSESGLFQVREVILREDTTNSDATILDLPSGSSTVKLPDNSSAILEVIVIGMNSDGSKVATFENKHILTKQAGTTRVDNSGTDVDIPMTLNIGSPTWQAKSRALGDGLVIRVFGEASETVRWQAYVKMTQCRF